MRGLERAVCKEGSSGSLAAIGAMMGLAREGQEAREGARMGVFGAAQAIGFGVGSFAGTVASDAMRTLTGSDALGYGAVFGAESLIFLVAALLALRLTAPAAPGYARSAVSIPGE